MSDLGEVAGAIGGEAVGLFMGVPLAIICVVSLPFMMIDKCSKSYAEKKQKVEQAAKVYDVVSNPKEALKHPIKTVISFKVNKDEDAPKETLSFRAGQAVKESGKDFIRGIFTKKDK